MKLFQPTPTPLDLRFRVFRIPVRVHPTFWFFSAIFGLHIALQRGFGYLMLWIACSFLAILIHELGHAGMGLIFGERGQMLLYSFGSFTIGEFHRLKFWQRLLVTAGAPALGFLFWYLMLQFKHHLLPTLDPAGAQLPLRRGVDYLLEVSFFWNLMNLLPIYPLDAGRLICEVAEKISPRYGFQYALLLSALIAASFATYSFLVYSGHKLWYPDLNPLFAGIFFSYDAIANFTEFLRARRDNRKKEPEGDGVG